MHELLHAVAGQAFLCQLPNIRDVRVLITLTAKQPAGDGECVLALPEPLRASIDRASLVAWAACGPMGFHLGPKDIGEAIAEGRLDDFLSESDIEKASRLGAIDQFVAACSAHYWRARLSVDSCIELNRVFTSDAYLAHEPMLPLDAICTGRLAVRMLHKARAAVTQHLPASVCTAATRQRLIA
ncbi:hypothetical protein [Usitatibacter rugosus]|nr:hypothetical protein [Usitatibacter rugosus]